MSTKDNPINDTSFQKLLHNDNYYQHIFKKTEKIVSVVFYILNNIEADKKSETHISNLASKAHLVHEHALRTLDARQSASREVLEQFAGALIGLDSTMRIAMATHLVVPDVASVVITEIDTVLRGLNSYIGIEGFDYGSVKVDTKPVNASKRVSSQPVVGESASASTAKVQTMAAATDRRERIKTILEAKGEATIKDISEIITDCSEKTIQRELNSMIEDNIVKRQGERRWSKYSMF